MRIEDLCELFHLGACAGSVLALHDSAVNVQKRLGNWSYTGDGGCRRNILGSTDGTRRHLKHPEATSRHYECVHAFLGGLQLAEMTTEPRGLTEATCGPTDIFTTAAVPGRGACVCVESSNAAAWRPPELAQNDPREPKRALWEDHGLEPGPQFHEKTPRIEKRTKFEAEEEKQRKIVGPHPSGSHPLGNHLSSPCSSAPALLGPNFFWVWAPRFRVSPHRAVLDLVVAFIITESFYFIQK